VIVARDSKGAIHGMVNRCAHKGVVICLKRKDNASSLTCVYHAWNYEIDGRLKSVTFRNGARGQGGMPDAFDASISGSTDIGPRSQRLARSSGRSTDSFGSSGAASGTSARGGSHGLGSGGRMSPQARLKKQRPPFNGSGNRKLHGRRIQLRFLSELHLEGDASPLARENLGPEPEGR
jgi:hypothetical protein